MGGGRPLKNTTRALFVFNFFLNTRTMLCIVQARAVHSIQKRIGPLVLITKVRAHGQLLL